MHLLSAPATDVGDQLALDSDVAVWHGRVDPPGAWYGVQNYVATVGTLGRPEGVTAEPVGPGAIFPGLFLD